MGKGRIASALPPAQWEKTSRSEIPLLLGSGTRRNIEYLAWREEIRTDQRQHELI